MKSESQKLKLLKESRSSHEKFHTSWTLLAGGTLTLLVGFIQKLSPITDPALRIIARFSIGFIMASLILSPIRNLLSALLVGRMAKLQEVTTYKEIIELFNEGKPFSFFANLSALLSIFLYIIGLALMAYVAMSIYL